MFAATHGTFILFYFYLHIYLFYWPAEKSGFGAYPLPLSRPHEVAVFPLLVGTFVPELLHGVKGNKRRTSAARATRKERAQQEAGGV